jgi:thiol-disulfide isomerase/thioredoxin
MIYCRRLLLPVLLLGFLPAFGSSALAADRADQTSPAKTAAENAALRQLLNLKLPDARQKTIDLAQWQGRIRVINLWATWCGPCKEEMPAFSRLQEKFQAQGVQFVGIAIDSAANVLAFSGKIPVSYPLLLGDDKILALSRELGNAYLGLPFTLVVDKEGQALARKFGRFKEEELAILLRAAPKSGNKIRRR